MAVLESDIVRAVVILTQGFIPMVGSPGICGLTVVDIRSVILIGLAVCVDQISVHRCTNLTNGAR